MPSTVFLKGLKSGRYRSPSPLEPSCYLRRLKMKFSAAQPWRLPLRCVKRRRTRTAAHVCPSVTCEGESNSSPTQTGGPCRTHTSSALTAIQQEPWPRLIALREPSFFFPSLVAILIRMFPFLRGPPTVNIDRKQREILFPLDDFNEFSTFFIWILTASFDLWFAECSIVILSKQRVL